MVDIGKALKKAIKQKGITQLALAVKAGVDGPYINGLCNNSRNLPTINTMIKVADGLGMKLSELIALGEDE